MRHVQSATCCLSLVHECACGMVVTQALPDPVSYRLISLRARQSHHVDRRHTVRAEGCPRHSDEHPEMLIYWCNMDKSLITEVSTTKSASEAQQGRACPKCSCPSE